MSDRAARGPDGESTAAELAARAVPELGGLVDDLVEGREDVVRKLDFRDGGLPHGGLIMQRTTPMPKATMPCSHSGVLNTRSSPYRSFRSSEQRNTPPNFTSSPKRIALSRLIYLVIKNRAYFLSLESAMSSAEFTAWNRFIFCLGSDAGMSLGS